METLIIALGIVSFILIYLSVVVDKEHFVAKLLLILTGITMLILIPSATLGDTCTPVINSTNATTMYNTTTTTYAYMPYCYAPQEGNTNSTFYKLFLWFFRAIWLYIFTYFVYRILLHYGVMVVGKGKNE